MKKRWILLAIVLWPALHFSVFLLRFRRLPPLWELLYFVPTGLLAALAVSGLMSRSRSAMQTASTLFGALAFAPIALVGNVMGGLLGPVGITVYGLVPLTAGATLGWLFGKRFPPRR